MAVLRPSAKAMVLHGERQTKATEKAKYKTSGHNNPPAVL
jgi:hypothetical protein